MANAATHQHAAAPAVEGAASSADLLDRWIYVLMAGLFIVVTLLGFVPDSITKAAAVAAGSRPPFPAILHVHSALMGTFLVLLLSQSYLAATNRFALHRPLGIAGGLLAVALVIVGFILVPTIYHQFAGALQASTNPEVNAAAIIERINNVMLLQLRVGVLFTLFMGIALYVRKSDSELHRRMMIIAITVALPAAFHRITWLPNTLADSALSAHLYIALAVSPMLIWDVIRGRKLHKAYVVWLAAFIPSVIIIDSLWGTQWWQETAPRIVGF